MGQMVLARDLSFAVKCENPIDELLARPDKRTVIVDRILDRNGPTSKSIEACLSTNEMLNFSGRAHCTDCPPSITSPWPTT